MDTFRSNVIIKGYLQKAYDLKKTEKGVIRNLDNKELGWVGSLVQQYKDFNLLVVEVILTKKILQQVGSKDLFYIQKNLMRVIASLCKQRDLAWAMKSSICMLKPNNDEIPEIKFLIKKNAERVIFVRKTVVAENLKLTPIQEYLEIIGEEDFTKDICRRFGTTRQICEVMNEREEEIAAYVEDILKTVRDAGKEKKYLDRLNSYILKEKEQEAKKKEAVLQEKLEKNRKLAEEGLLGFERAFHDNIRKKDESKLYHMDLATIYRRILDYGYSAWVVLSTHMRQQQCVYRYLGQDGEPQRFFKKAGIWKTEEEAIAVMNQVKELHPDWIFDTVQFSNLEEIQNENRA